MSGGGADPLDTSVARTVRQVRANGAEVRVSVRGDGPPLLLFMGIGAGLELWEPFEEAMAPLGHRLVALDLPGAGASPPVVPPLRMAGLVDVAVGVLDELGLGTVDVLGLSFGGAVAQQFARQAAERTRRLVLAATSTGALSVPARPDVLFHMVTPARYRIPIYGNRIAPMLYGGRTRREPDARGVLRHRHTSPPSSAGYLGQLWAGAGWTSVGWLPRVQAPTLVLAGTDDPIIPTANAHLLHRLLPNSTLQLVEGGGHLFLLDDAEQSASTVHAFLS